MGRLFRIGTGAARPLQILKNSRWTNVANLTQAERTALEQELIGTLMAQVRQFAGIRVSANTLHHIFGRAKHKLGPLLARFGGNQELTFRVVFSAASRAIQQHGITGVFNNLVVNVGGMNVTVTGTVLNGVVRVSNFWIP